MTNNHLELGSIETSERLIQDLYIDLRKKVNYWASITHQTAQARMGYIGQHLVSIVTGYLGGKSGARGYDLIISDNDYGEIKTCYRVDQLGKCNSCTSVVASIELVCPVCNSTDIDRKDDSKWLIGIRNEDEFANTISPKLYYLVLFDFVDLNNPDEIRASIWQVDPRNIGFAFCLIDYYLNIRANSTSKAPFNLWPFQLKFYLMKPFLIYRCIIRSDDTIDTQIFPGRDNIQQEIIPALTEFSRSQNLTKPKIITIGKNLGISLISNESKSKLLSTIEQFRYQNNISDNQLADVIAQVLYGPEIYPHLNELPQNLRNYLSSKTN